jgi:hypothetical protein
MVVICQCGAAKLISLKLNGEQKVVANYDWWRLFG